jgi:hypothetical protein
MARRLTVRRAELRNLGAGMLLGVHVSGGRGIAAPGDPTPSLASV